ncbi:retrovirus-related pol polyprotein from transposon TNT 1-94 [Tanacetum coccineum]
MKVEESLNVTFDETPLPSKTSPLEDDDLVEEEAIENPIGTKWIFRNKLDKNGVVSRNKARLVTQGYNQQEGIDYDETYAPVARLESIRILLAYVCTLDLKLFQMDVKSAILNGFINEEVHVAQPPGFIDFAKHNHVYRLKKALYGLKQALKPWYDRLKAFLIKHDYTMGMVDNILFTKKKDPNLIIVQIYVDDIIFGSTYQEICNDFAKIMHDKFEMSMMGELNFFLGLQIKQLEDGIFFNQSKYIKEMLKKFGLEDSKSMKTPISTETKLTKDVEEPTTHVAEEAAPMPHDSPLPRVHSLGSDEGSLTLNELMGRKIAQIDKDDRITLVQMGAQTQERSDEDLMYETGVYDYPEGFTGPSISITTAEPVTTAGEGVSTRLEQNSLKKLKLLVEMEDVRAERKGYLQHKGKQHEQRRVGDHTEAYQTFDDMLKKFDRDDLDKLWSLVKERFSSTDPTDDKERILWVELKRLFEPDIDDILWKLQRYMHDPLTWRLYDTCGVHHVSTDRGHDIFMLVEKDYPLTRGLMTVMLANKLQVDQSSEMANELLRKIFIQAERPRQ